MRYSIDKKTTITLTSANDKIEFYIDDVRFGGSCIVYKVSYFENGDIPHKGILKEYCPAYLEKYNFSRVGTSIEVPVEIQDVFNNGLIEFKNTYKNINRYLSNCVTAANYHTVQLGLYEGNNTAYTLTSFDYGKTYNEIEDNNLLSIFKILLSVTKAVEMYHNAGYLHLDIKPKNILILDDVTDIVKLFDFDSLTSISKVKSREIFSVPIPEDYYVPELKGFNLRNIGVQTDIYEIGAMAYSRIFKSNPSIDDIENISNLKIGEEGFFIGVSPQAKFEVLELLKNTLQISKHNRYKTIGELKNQLKKIISLLNEKTPYPVNLPKWQPVKGCVGRQDELSEIKRRLDRDGYVFVKGIGGIGKSEIAKLFANSYADSYHTVQFCRFNGSLRTLVASMPFYGIDDNKYKDFNELVNSKNKALHLTDKNTLIIVDNFNIRYDDFLRDFLPSDQNNFKVIFTTRCKPINSYYDDKVLELTKLSLDDCKKVFALHSSFPEKFEEINKVEKLIETVDYNTLIISLLSAAIKKSGSTPDYMLEKLENQELKDFGQELFHEYDVTSEEIKNYNAIYAHLTTIFSVSGLSDTQKQIIKNATLISSKGMSVSDFVSWCDDKNINHVSVDEVSQWSWINIDENNIITMHPIVSDLIADNNDIIKTNSYYYLAENIENYCNPDYMSHISVIMDRLSCAVQLERRYKNEDAFKRALIAVKLGRMYQNAYYPAEAKKHLLNSLDIAESEKLKKGLPDSYKAHKNLKEKLILREINITGQATKKFIPYIYYFLGEFEKDFGSKTKAIEYFNKSIDCAKRFAFFYIIIESKLSIAECYADNNNTESAYKEYVSAYKCARLCHLNEQLTPIATELVEICKRLNYKSEEIKYKKYAEQYSKFSEVTEIPKGLSEFNESVELRDFEGALKNYDVFLAYQRQKLGESSPIYKDLSKGLWVFYAVNGQKEQALKLLSDAITFTESTYGKSSMELADLLALAARLMPNLLEFNYSYDFANRAVEICGENDEKNSYVYISAKMALINVATILNKPYEAKEYMKDIDFSSFSGNDFLEDVVQSVGIALANLSEYNIAEKLCEELLARDNASDFAKFQAYIILSASKEQQGFLEDAERYANASKQFAECIKTDSIRYDWLVQYYRTVARIEYRKGSYSNAILKLDELIGLFDNKKAYILSSVYTERGLYYTYLGNSDAANKDYAFCEKILVENHLSDEAFVQLYNNIAVNYQRNCNYSEAMKYLEKIVKINPNVLSPKSYFETIVCANIGWLSFLSDNSEKAEKLLNSAIANFERLAAIQPDYYKAKVNLAAVYVGQKKYSDAVKIFLEIREKYNCSSDASGEFAKNTCEGILNAYFGMKQAQEAYDFARKEIQNLEQWFGKYSIIRINEIIMIGGIFRVNGYSNCYNFFSLAEELLYNANLTKTVQYASILNYIGVCKTDYEQKHIEASRLFEDSKKLYEELDETDDDNYKVVLNNIEYIRDLATNEAISDLVSSMSCSDDENN